MATYYATVKVEGTYSFQDIKVQAQSGHEAKKIIEMRLGGKVKSWLPDAGIKTTQMVSRLIIPVVSLTHADA